MPRQGFLKSVATKIQHPIFLLTFIKLISSDTVLFFLEGVTKILSNFFAIIYSFSWILSQNAQYNLILRTFFPKRITCFNDPLATEILF